jgi:hypothetical protein
MQTGNEVIGVNGTAEQLGIKQPLEFPTKKLEVVQTL